ncbi:MAG: hypothetical protein U0169_03985 [Polyangiaceae bacterium]
MIRQMFAALSVVLGVATLSGTGCKATGVGDPCTPEQEFDPAFNGFDEKEVNAESKSFQCQTRLCLVNHFRGRVSCKFGQKSDGTPRDPEQPCVVPGTSDPITGDPNNTSKKAEVPAQCASRTSDRAVYCSCRCANADGRTDDGANYCTCPDGFQCEQLVTPIGPLDTGLTGAYCIKATTKYNAAEACVSCDPTSGNCK